MKICPANQVMLRKAIAQRKHDFSTVNTSTVLPNSREINVLFHYSYSPCFKCTSTAIHCNQGMFVIFVNKHIFGASLD